MSHVGPLSLLRVLSLGQRGVTRGQTGTLSGRRDPPHPLTSEQPVPCVQGTSLVIKSKHVINSSYIILVWTQRASTDEEQTLTSQF